MVDRWCRLREQLEEGRVSPGDGPGALERTLPAFTEALCDDLNIARAIGSLNEAVGASRVEGAEAPADPDRARRELDALLRMDHVLGVLDRNQASTDSTDDQIAGVVEERITARSRAKEEKDWATADLIRDELASMGIAIKDGPEGTTWSRVVE